MKRFKKINWIKNSYFFDGFFTTISFADFFSYKINSPLTKKKVDLDDDALIADIKYLKQDIKKINGDRARQNKK